jgi:hypothetical protein
MDGIVVTTTSAAAQTAEHDDEHIAKLWRRISYRKAFTEKLTRESSKDLHQSQYSTLKPWAR